MNILQKIFKEHYEEIEYTLHPRPIVMENIEKMIGCGDPSYGGAMYACTHCGELKFVPFRCHSKFCPTFKDVLMTDGLEQYHKLAREQEELTNANCFAHARRHFANAIKAMGKGNAEAVKASVAYKALAARIG